MYQNDSYLTIFVKFHFTFWTKIGLCLQYLFAKIEKYKKLFKYMFFISLISFCFVANKQLWVQISVISLFFVSTLCVCCSQKNSPLLCLRGFLRNRILCYAIGFIMTVFVLMKIDLNTDLTSLVCVVVFAIPWVIYSSIARAEVSVLGNALLAVLIGLIPSFLDYMNITFLSESFNSYEMMKEAFKIVWFPFFFSSSLGTIVSLLKQYWIQKNKYDDVHILTSEELQQPISIFLKTVLIT